MHKVVFLTYEGMELLDLSGPQTAFFEANVATSNFYQLSLAGFGTQVVRSEAGTQIIPDSCITQMDYCDTLVIPGGRGARLHPFTAEQLQQLAEAIGKAKRIVSVCTGAFLLARSLTGKPISLATHWAYAKDLRLAYPHLNVDEYQLFTQDGNIWSSAGVTAGIDLALHLIELDTDKQTAMQVSKSLVVYLRRSGSQQQFSDLLLAQQSKHPLIQEMIQFIQSNLSNDLSVRMLASKACLSERQLHRLFIKEVAEPPAAFVEKLRMNTAKELILANPQNLKGVAANLGFKSYDGFRRAFERQFGVSPKHFKSLFLTN